GRLTEAISCFDDAIARYRRLVEEGGRVELENDLAGALMNKGVALEQLQRWKEALNCYSEGIELWERLVEGGMTHVTPNLIKSLKIRFDLLRQLGVWEVAATDVVRALSYAASLLEKESASESVMQELMGFLQRLRMLSEQERAQLYSALGKWGEVVRRLIES
ncbi:MAG: tetratricopeptide repeat protein, partial [Archaeoglobaceae archaeon]